MAYASGDAIEDYEVVGDVPTSSSQADGHNDYDHRKQQVQVPAHKVQAEIVPVEQVQPKRVLVKETLQTVTLPAPPDWVDQPMRILQLRRTEPEFSKAVMAIPTGAMFQFTPGPTCLKGNDILWKMLARAVESSTWEPTGHSEEDLIAWAGLKEKLRDYNL